MKGNLVSKIWQWVLVGLVVGLLGISQSVGAEEVQCDYAVAGLPDCYEPIQYGYDNQGQPNVPRANLQANACFGTGTLADECADERDWRIGWHLIRLQTGVLDCSQVPTELYAELARLFDCSIKPPAPVTPVADGRCGVLPVVAVPSLTLRYYIGGYEWLPLPGQAAIRTNHAGVVLPVVAGQAKVLYDFPPDQPPYTTTAELLDGTGTVLFTFPACPVDPRTLIP